MGTSIIELQREIFIQTVRHATGSEWKVLVVDEGSKRLIDNVTKEDDILNEGVTNFELIEKRRPLNRESDAVYLLSPLPHIVDCLLADLEKSCYRRFFLVWISVLDPHLRSRIDRLPTARELIADFRILNIDFFPRESHLITFRDPWSFPVLFHPACNNLIREHLEGLAKKVVSICVSLGEYPTIRYYKPRSPNHEASVLCSHLARFVQQEMDLYAQYHQDFPPPASRPNGVLFIVDRTMDLFSPLVHEFTYQAMALDLLPVNDGDKVTYTTVMNQGRPNEEHKEMEIGEKDKIWVANRHMHMKDLLGKLVGDFNKFRADNPQFADSDGASTSVNTIKDMLAGLPQYQEGKESFSLHLDMAEQCMKVFNEHKLLDVGSVEQSLATGLDEDFKKPKNMADQLVRLLDEPSVPMQDRLRLIMLYILYRGGLLGGDIRKLLAHANLPPQKGETIGNLDLLGARISKPLKENTPLPQPLFAPKPAQTPVGEEAAFTRFEPALKTMLEEQVKGALDPAIFPLTKPHLADGLMQDNVSQASLRSASKPTWARTRPSANEPRQRIIVFMAGGATYAEVRACYEVSQHMSKDVFLATSHMLTPSLFLRQISDLSTDKRRLDIPAERPKPRAPDHLFEREPQPPSQPPSQSQSQPSTQQRSRQEASRPSNPAAPPVSKTVVPPTANLASMTIGSQGMPPQSNGSGLRPTSPAPPQHLGGKLTKDKNKDKKKKGLFK